MYFKCLAVIPSCISKVHYILEAGPADADPLFKRRIATFWHSIGGLWGKGIWRLGLKIFIKSDLSNWYKNIANILSTTQDQWVNETGDILICNLKIHGFWGYVHCFCSELFVQDNMIINIKRIIKIRNCALGHLAGSVSTECTTPDLKHLVERWDYFKKKKKRKKEK